MGSVTKLAPITDVNSGIKTPHMNMTIRVGRTTNADKLIMMPHGVTPPTLINDGMNVIANKIIRNKTQSKIMILVYLLRKKIFIISLCRIPLPI